MTAVADLEQALVDRTLERLRAVEPEATAILLTGSYAKGTATPGSDLDLVAITPTPRAPYRGWFEERDGAPLKVEAAATTADSWETKAASPARWSLGFPALTTAAWLWTDDATRTRIGDDPSRRHPAAGPELEDFLDFLLKGWRCGTVGDELGLRLFAQEAATRAPTLLIPLNAERVVRDRRDALDAALSLAVAPDDFAFDMTVCLGLTPATGGEIGDSVARLGRGLLAFVRERAPDIDPQPELARYLADGTLERHLAATIDDA